MAVESVSVVRGWPVIGVALQLHKNPLRFFSETTARYGDRVELRVLRRTILLLPNPADVNEVLSLKAADFDRSTEVKNLRPSFGDGIYSSEGERWRKQRRIVQPAFHHDRIVKYASTIVERMTERASRWQPGERLDAFQEMMAFATDVIWR